MKTHDPHDAIHDLVTVNHKKYKSPKKPTKASHEAQCTATVKKVRKKTVDNIKRSHSLKNVPEVLLELRRSKGLLRAWRWHRTVELILVRIKMIEIQAAALAPSELVHSYLDKDDTKGWATDREETNGARVRRPTKVIESRNPTLVKISSINFVRHEGADRTQRTSLLENGRTNVEIVKGLLEEKNIVLPLRPETHKVQNPKAQKSRPVTHKATSTKEIESGSREEKDTLVVAVSRTKKHTRLKAVTEEKGGMGNTEWRNTVGKRKEVVAKSKLESLIGEPVPIKKIR